MPMWVGTGAVARGVVITVRRSGVRVHTDKAATAHTGAFNSFCETVYLYIYKRRGVRGSVRASRPQRLVGAANPCDHYINDDIYIAIWYARVLEPF